MRGFLLLWAALFLGLNACIEPINFEGTGAKLLIVDGHITNQAKVHSIRLSRAADYSEENISGVAGATVYITDDLGNETFLEPRLYGYYLTPATFTGIEGRTYTLHIRTAEGEAYVSQPQLLHTEGELDSVYFAKSEREYLTKTNNIGIIRGIEYYIDYTMPANKPAYFMWQWEGVYEVYTTYPSDSVPDICYITESNTGFRKVRSSTDFASNSIVKDDFLFVAPDYKYWNAYSMLIEQYTISKDVYEFFHAIELQQKNTGSIFDPTPTRITGNITNVNNPEETVLGYFGAFGVESKRIFVHDEDVPPPLTDYEIGAKARNMYFGCNANPPLNYCVDCRFWPNSTAEKPEYWE